MLYCQEADCIIACLYGQEAYGREGGHRYTDYGALQRGLTDVSVKAQELTKGQKVFRVALPDHLGCGPTGQGEWGIVRKMIEVVFGGSDIQCEIWMK